MASGGLAQHNTEIDRRVLKRSFDIIVAAAGLLVTFPVLVVVGLLVWFDLGRPVLFRQARPGRNAVPFTLIKFRTMRVGSGSETDSERLTPLGALLRRTSLDELPELWNVLVGDMSLVGPRPLPYFTEEERRRHDVRPGITGLAQVSGRNFLGWNERLAADVEYVETRSMWLDLRIIWRTFVNLLSRADVARDPSAIMKDLDDERRSADHV